MLYRHIEPSELESWAKLCEEGFNGDWKYFVRHYVNDPYADPEGVFVADDDGKLASSVRVFTREVYIRGEKVKMGGIGEVTTLKEYRGQGISTVLLRKAVEYMESRGLNISFLFTGTNHHYAHVGWFTVPRRYLHIALDGSPSPLKLRRACDEDIPLLASLHQKFAPSFSGSVVRDEEYIRRWTGASSFVLAFDGDEPTASAIWEAKGENLNISEFIGAKESFKPYLNAAASESCQKFASFPAVYAQPGDGFDFSESNSLMARLNLPFEAGGERVDSVPSLLSALSDAVFFNHDGF